MDPETNRHSFTQMLHIAFHKAWVSGPVHLVYFYPNYPNISKEESDLDKESFSPHSMIQTTDPPT